MDSYGVMEVCRAYDKLGWAVTSQLEELMQLGDPDAGEFNMNALAMIHEFFTLAARFEDDEYGEFQGLKDELERYAEMCGGEFRYGTWTGSSLFTGGSHE